MGFNDQATLRNSGVTLGLVQKHLVKAVRDANIVDPRYVRAVLDDESIPKDNPVDDRFITVRYPSLVWAYGDVFSGDGVISEFDVQGQVRYTLWLRNELDVYGDAEIAMTQAAFKPPKGAGLLGQLIASIWETQVLDDDGFAILKRPLLFVSYDPPNAGFINWRPFRVVVQCEFRWDLSAELQPAS